MAGKRREIILEEANPMSGVFQNIDPPLPGECVPPAFGAGGGHTRWGGGGGGVNILEDARHSSVLYLCKYFVLGSIWGTRECGVTLMGGIFKGSLTRDF